MNLPGLLHCDWRNIRRDPMLFFALLLPICLALLLKYGLTQIHHPKLAFLSPHKHLELLHLFYIPICSQLMGWVAGFLLLDERDGLILQNVATTPLGYRGFLAYRLGLPFFFALPLTLLGLNLSGLPITFSPGLLLIVGLNGLQGSMLTLFLGTYANNKVDGLALTKLTNLVLIVPILLYFWPGDWNWLLAPSPTFWTAKLHLSLETTGPQWWFWALIAVLFHMAMLRYLYGQNLRREIQPH